MQSQIVISENFRKMAMRSIFAILFFILSYLGLVAVAGIFTALCFFLSFGIISMHFSFLTIALAAGIAGMGVLIVIFLLKFLFSSSKVDRSDLIEIHEETDPDLFRFIREITEKIQTRFPKRIYISADVNASVFYDSSFWSMFFPVRKNLQIGLGLVNSVTRSELKAILAHEFGHFSQRSMKVGSYVYNVNRVIYNMLYENDGYQKMASGWAEIHGVVAMFTMLAVGIVQGIQWVLREIYKVVNVNYMALSREMEFHADAVAAHVAGSENLASGLLRLNLADQSFNALLQYYNQRISDKIKSRNLYPQQSIVMGLVAKDSEIKIEHGLPEVTTEQFVRFNKSKLIIKNQWASHPSTEDRVEALRILNINKGPADYRPAGTVFTNIQQHQEMLTTQIFSGVDGAAKLTAQEDNQFAIDYLRELSENRFPAELNGYYDQHDPVKVKWDEIKPDPNLTMHGLFTEEFSDKVFTLAALKADIEVLLKIATKKTGIKTLDYDGIKYSHKDCDALLSRLREELSAMEAAVREHDLKIAAVAMGKSQQKGNDEQFKKLYDQFVEINRITPFRLALMQNVVGDLSFTQVRTDLDEIIGKQAQLGSREKEWKIEIRSILDDPENEGVITTKIRKVLELYCSDNWIYFNGHNYNNDNLGRLYSAFDAYSELVLKVQFAAKKKLLEFMVSLN